MPNLFRHPRLDDEIQKGITEFDTIAFMKEGMEMQQKMVVRRSMIKVTLRDNTDHSLFFLSSIF